MGIAGAPPWGVSAPDLAMGTWAWVQTRGIRRSPAARAHAHPGTSESRMLRGFGFVTLLQSETVNFILFLA